MADELNVPTHRWYEPRNNIALPPNAVSPKYILANGVAMIDAWINSQPWGMPLYLFAASEPGWLYDNSDMSTLFQDSAGTTPVTAVGQPVGLQLDKSKGLVLGPELVTNGDFSAGSTGWVEVNGTLSATSGVGVFTGSTSIASALYQDVPFAATWAEFRVRVRLASGSSAVPVAVRQYNSFANAILLATVTSSTFQELRFLVRNDGGGVRVYFGAFPASTPASVLEVDNISVKELAGTHRYQTTTASRPTFARLPVTGRRNLLTYTEDFNNWSKLNSTATASGDAWKIVGDNSATDVRVQQNYIVDNNGKTETISITAKADDARYVHIGRAGAGVWFDLQDGAALFATSGFSGIISAPDAGGYRRISVTFIESSLSNGATTQVRIYVSVNAPLSANPVASGNDGVRGILVKNAQRERGALTSYQKVVSLYDITEAGVQTAYGLYYDGVDDFLVTPTITPGTDKVQVFAGVRKLSDAALGILIESGLVVTTTNGSFAIAAPRANGVPGYQYATRGTVVVPVNSPNTFIAPITNVLTSLGDISGDRATLRVNGTQVAQSTADQGTGDYLAYPVYFGRRGGTTLPFNGYTFREIGRFGPNLDAATIANVENWINQNTGAY